MRMIKTNLEKLVDLAVSGTAGHPATGDSGEKAAYDGGSASPLGFSGINFTVKVGDSAFDWAGTHEVSPGVAVKNCCDSSNEALLALSCIGNEAILVDAKMEGKDAKLKGTPGVVTGKLSAGRVLVYFPKRVVERITVGDQIQIRASGSSTIRTSAWSTWGRGSSRPSIPRRRAGRCACPWPRSSPASSWAPASAGPTPGRSSTTSSPRRPRR